MVFDPLGPVFLKPIEATPDVIKKIEEGGGKVVVPTRESVGLPPRRSSGRRSSRGRRITPSAPSGDILQQVTTREMDKIQGPPVPSARTIQSQLSTSQRQEALGEPILKPGEVRGVSRKPTFIEEGGVPITQGVVSAVERPSGFFRGAEADVLQRKSLLETKGVRGKISPFGRAELFGLGLGLTIARFPIRTFEFGKALLTSPIETITSAPGGFKARFEEIGAGLAGRTPEFAFGEVAGEIATFKGLGKAPKLIQKGTDIFRTTRLKELPIADIVAPEFTAGQTFPTIKSGQTAGQLLQEFKPLFPGETKAAGFTAAPRPFAKVTEAGVGTSELPGVFQSPRVSPRFLRIGGEEGRALFSTKVFDTFRPTITRITPTGFELAPKVKFGQVELAPLKQTQEFFQTAPKGKSIVPFIKTEKEAVIPFGTKLQEIDRRFFIKFEGRRVPIREFKTVGEDLGIARVTPKITARDVSRISSRGRISQPGLVTPLSSLSFIPSRLESFTQIPRGRKISPISSFVSPFSSVDISPPIPSIISPSSIKSRRIIPPADLPSFPPPSPFDNFEPEKTSRKRRRRKSDDRKKKKPVKEKKEKKRKTKIAPSFTSIVAELTGGLPEQVEIGGVDLGILPSKLRRL